MQLITGGLGFIGNELARQLVREQSVAILDNHHRVAPRIDDLGHLTVHDVDITDAAAVSRVLEAVRPRVVFHLAAVHYIPECNADPERTLRVNVEGTLAVLNACAAARVEHLIVASSGAVYADAADPLKESSPVAPVDVYGWSKSFAESICRWHSSQTGMPVTICRL
ncbi:MAG: NAD(P)-dependent oxidoreductase, partial [Gemmatimonadaceae bacterium]